jgi:DNA repair exonuclease SbcCD nuclease subunit
LSGFTFLHAADLHIDSPLLGLDRYEGAPVAEIRIATRRALENLVALALAERVAFVVLAGDVFDGDWRDFNTGLFFNAQLARLERAGIRVFMVNGNHDAQATMTRSLRLPPNTKLFAHDAPETVVMDELHVAIHGQSFPEQKVTRNLAVDYPPAAPGCLNIGILHTSMGGREGHVTYAPCTLEDLAVKGYDYWALGHVHRREVVSSKPWVVFPGNLQGRHVREPGSKGCSVVGVRDGRVSEVRHVPLDVVRWASVVVDVSQCASPEDVVDLLAAAVGVEIEGADGRLLAARVTATGRTPAASLRAEPRRWRAELLARLASVTAGTVWLEKTLFDLEHPIAPHVDGGEGLAVFDAILAELALADETTPAFVKELERRIGGDVPRDLDSPFAPDAIARARADAVDLLRFRLRTARGGRA